MTNKYRVAVCEHTHHKVIQLKYGEEFLCLHNDSYAEDEQEASLLESGAHPVYVLEAEAMLKEYRMGDTTAHYYISSRACKDWRDR